MDYAQLNQIAAQAGDCFYLVDPTQFRANFQAFTDAFTRHYGRTDVAYSYKTNYLPAFCGMVNDLGGFAEVVSRMEYDMARRHGVPGERIIVNGPVRTQEDLQLALQEGATVNLDSPYQIKLIRELGLKEARVGLRCNFDIGNGQVSRFGFDADGDELVSALAELQEQNGVTVVGLHCHFATGTRSVDAYRMISRRMIKLADELFASTVPDYIDIGGGYFSPMGDELATQFGGDIPTYDQYGQAIAGAFANRYGPDGPRLILEPGVALAANTMKLATRVLDVRTIRDRRIVQVAAGVQLLKPAGNNINLPATVVRPNGEQARDRTNGQDVTGYTCMERDILFTGFEQSVQSGDFLVFENVGAYSIVMAPPFIHPAPGIIELDAGEPVFHRLPQDADAILSTFA